MNVEKAIELYSEKSELEQVYFLALLGHQLTIIGRDCYEVGGRSLTNPPHLRNINELIHRVFGTQSHLMLGDTNRFPDETVIRMLYEGAAFGGFEHDIRSAVEVCFEYCDRDPLRSTPQPE